jgi:hypothetical protein
MQRLKATEVGAPFLGWPSRSERHHVGVQQVVAARRLQDVGVVVGVGTRGERAADEQQGNESETFHRENPPA